MWIEILLGVGVLLLIFGIVEAIDKFRPMG